MFIFTFIGEIACSILFALLETMSSIIMIIPNALIAFVNAVAQFCFTLPSAILGGIVTVLGAVWSLLTFWV